MDVEDWDVVCSGVEVGCLETTSRDNSRCFFGLLFTCTAAAIVITVGSSREEAKKSHT
jgi:hypothetical protein